MNLPLSAPASSFFTTAPTREDVLDAAQTKRLRGLMGLLFLYALSLFTVVLLSDGPDVGCILAAIAGHVVYASFKIATSWRDAAWMSACRLRVKPA